MSVKQLWHNSCISFPSTWTMSPPRMPFVNKAPQLCRIYWLNNCSQRGKSSDSKLLKQLFLKGIHK